MTGELDDPLLQAGFGGGKNDEDSAMNQRDLDDYGDIGRGE